MQLDSSTKPNICPSSIWSSQHSVIVLQRGANKGPLRTSVHRREIHWNR